MKGRVIFFLFSILLVAYAKSNRHIVLHKTAIHTLEAPTPSLLLTEKSTNEYQWLVHVSHTLTGIERKELNDKVSPYKLGTYIPHNTYLFTAPASEARKLQSNPKVLWIGLFDAEHKLPTSFDSAVSSETKSLLVMLASTPSRKTVAGAESIAKKWEQSISETGKEVKIKAMNKDKLTIQVSKLSVEEIKEVAQWVAQQSESHWIEPSRKVQFHNKYAGPVTFANNLTSPFVGFVNTNLNGSSQIVGLADSGIDVNSCYFQDPNALPSATLNENLRKIIRYYPSAVGDTSDDSGHGTFVAGVIAGSSLYNNSTKDWNGVAPGAKITFYDISKNDAGYTNTDDFRFLMFTAFSDYASIFLASFGGSANWYSLLNVDIDDTTYGVEDYLIVVAAGTNSLSDLSYSKNALVVGASQSAVETLSTPLSATSGTINTANTALTGTQVLASFSPHGPTPDGRIKPDIVAPGQRITSAARGACGVETREGTSYSAAVAAGAAAIVRDYFTKNYFQIGGDPYYFYGQTAALVKAMLINSAQSLLVGDANGNGNYISLRNFWPSSYQGFGRIELDKVLAVSGSDFNLQVYDDRALEALDGITKKSKRYCTRVLPGARFLKITLVWTDPAATPASGAILVNDLDLVLYDRNGNEYRSQTADGDFDRVNNVEQIYIENPPAGVMAYAVHAHRITTEVGQSWALVATGNADFTISCDQVFDNATHPICPQGCSGHGTCVMNIEQGAVCNCDSGFVGVDCSQTPCLNNCGGNGYCDHITSTCICNLNYDPATGCTKPLPESGTPQDATPIVITQSASTNIGYYIGVGILGLVLGGLVFGVIGFFCAVRFLEKKRDELMKEKDNEMS